MTMLGVFAYVILLAWFTVVVAMVCEQDIGREVTKPWSNAKRIGGGALLFGMFASVGLAITVLLDIR